MDKYKDKLLRIATMGVYPAKQYAAHPGTESFAQLRGSPGQQKK